MESTPPSFETKLYFHLSGLKWILFCLVIIFTAASSLPAKTTDYQSESPLLQTNEAIQDTLTDEIITEIPDAEIEVVPGTVTEELDTEDDADETETETIIIEFSGPFTKTELRKGERLFKGLLAFSSGMHDCSSCHYTSRTDTLNWNPSAYDLAVIWQENDNYSIREKLSNPAGMRMMNDHADMLINAEEERQLEAYLDKVLSSGPGDIKSTPVNALIFWGLGFLMALALLDLLITKKLKIKALHILVIIIGLVVHMQYAVAESRALGRTEGYAPDQPIKFSHLIHAGENEIDCNYCHTISSFSLSAGIPSNNTCLNCHDVIIQGSNSGRFEINKIKRAEASGNPVRWIRVHKLPDHSFFSHAQHVNAGQLDCQECHGAVEEMHIVKQVEDLSMGWCLTCHRDNHVDFLANPYYQIYESLHNDIRAGRIDAVTAARVGGEDCMKCHY
jgi:hypothetical protein